MAYNRSIVEFSCVGSRKVGFIAWRFGAPTGGLTYISRLYRMHIYLSPYIYMYIYISKPWALMDLSFANPYTP